MDRPEVNLDDLYRDVVMDHYRSPRGRQALPDPDVANDGQNPLCGDEIHLALKFDGGTVKKVLADSHGCAISVASGSIMAEMLEGRSEAEARKLADAFKKLMHGDPLPKDLDLGDLTALEGVRQFPVRVKCAMLPWTTLTDALDAHDHGTAPTAPTTTEDDADSAGPAAGVDPHAGDPPPPAPAQAQTPKGTNPLEGAPPPEGMPSREKVIDALRTVEDPEIALNLIDLGLVYGIEYDAKEKMIKVRMTLTTPYCPYGPELVSQAKAAVDSLEGVKFADVQLVWDPVWDPRTMAADHVKDKLGLW